MLKLDTTSQRIYEAVPHGEPLSLAVISRAARVLPEIAEIHLVFQEMDNRVRQSPEGYYRRQQL